MIKTDKSSITKETVSDLDAPVQGKLYLESEGILKKNCSMSSLNEINGNNLYGMNTNGDTKIFPNFFDMILDRGKKIDKIKK